MKLILKYLPWIVTVFMGLYVVSKAFPPRAKTEEMNLYAFGKIPVQHGGRIQPLDSLARNVLVIITSGRQQYEYNQNTYPAIQWLLEVLAGRNRGIDLPVYRIDDPDLRLWLDLPNKPGSYRYSYQEIMSTRGKEFDVRAQATSKKEPAKLKQFDHSLLSLAKNMDMQLQLVKRSAPGIIPDPTSTENKWLLMSNIHDSIDEGVAEQARAAAQEDYNADLKNNPQKYAQARDIRTPAEFKDWLDQQQMVFFNQQLKTLSDQAMETAFPQAQLFEKILEAYSRNNVENFNRFVDEYHTKYVSTYDETEVKKASVESWMNHFDPFFVCKVLYIMVIVLALLSWLIPAEVPIRQSAFNLAVFTLALHTGALVLRMFIGSRPPVTNLYSSAVFIGWGALFMCVIMELLYKNSLSTFIGGLIGFGTLQIAQLLSHSGDTLEMLQAVLDTNFWLATHVTIVTLGYTATYVAGLLGAFFILAGFFTQALRADQGRGLYQMMYGTMCFATLLSFVGTVLGGIWADQSWGRFWGWDPKENGAVLIVIWNAMVLHARWAGLIKSRGFAVMAVFGNSITTWSWFGTNQLGIGLHAYGFNSTLALTCNVVWILSTVVMIMGLVPLSIWGSFAKLANTRDHA